MKKNTNIEKNIFNYKKGFTIIEALVAIFILTISVTALLGVVSQSVFNSNYAKNKAIAVGLAQEGIELVKNIQDTTLLNGDYSNSQFEIVFGDINNPLYLCMFQTGFCTIDPISLAISSCPNQDPDQPCPPLNISNTGRYDYSQGGSVSPFTRIIEVDKTGVGGKSGKVTVTVSWKQGSVTKSVVYETELFMWIQ